MVAPRLAGELPLSELKKERQRYLRHHLAGVPNSASADVINFVDGLEKMCAQKGAKCAK